MTKRAVFNRQQIAHEEMIRTLCGWQNLLAVLNYLSIMNGSSTTAQERIDFKFLVKKQTDVGFQYYRSKTKI